MDQLWRSPPGASPLALTVAAQKFYRNRSLIFLKVEEIRSQGALTTGLQPDLSQQKVKLSRNPCQHHQIINTAI
jgi:hypothetical protein